MSDAIFTTLFANAIFSLIPIYYMEHIYSLYYTIYYIILYYIALYYITLYYIMLILFYVYIHII